MTEAKTNALINYLMNDNNITEEEARQAITGTETYTTNEIETTFGDYLVLTDEEADTRAAEEIAESLWAFNPEFILEHMRGYEDLTGYEEEAVVEALKTMQSKLCESANAVVKTLIEDLDAFTENAIDIDGRGHFISWYDGRENEQDDFYIYRTN